MSRYVKAWKIHRAKHSNKSFCKFTCSTHKTSKILQNMLNSLHEPFIWKSISSFWFGFLFQRFHLVSRIVIVGQETWYAIDAQFSSLLSPHKHISKKDKRKQHFVYIAWVMTKKIMREFFPEGLFTYDVL